MKLNVSEIIVGTLVMIILLLTAIHLKSEVRFPFSFINLIEVIAALGTTVAALAAWKSASAANSSARITSEQLKEMQKARKSQI
ncbi:hypothetical protein LG307_16720 [Sutcliffiella horikoshii]|uniref:hypothetical protein n=1 Tax=Sutcliffiella horikoshii TaxID=79883 RepID=UPI00384E2781